MGVEGAAAKEVWTFHAEEKGKSTIYMGYRRSWEQDVEPAETFTLIVVVKSSTGIEDVTVDEKKVKRDRKRYCGFGGITEGGGNSLVDY